MHYNAQSSFSGSCFFVRVTAAIAAFPEFSVSYLIFSRDVDRSQNKDSTGDEKLTAKQLGEYFTKLTEDFPIVSIEDGFDQVCILHRTLRAAALRRRSINFDNSFCYFFAVIVVPCLLRRVAAIRTPCAWGGCPCESQEKKKTAFCLFARGWSCCPMLNSVASRQKTR